MADTLAGLDVSHYQNTVDWQQVASASKTFSFIKASEGAHTPDERFSSNRAGASKNGVMAGAYHFFRPKVDVDAQVQAFTGLVSALMPGELPPVLDLEAPKDWTGIAIADRVTLVLRWLTKVKQALGVTPIVYASPDFVKSVLHSPSALAAYPLWLAHYALSPVVPAPWSDWTFWQYTQAGAVTGVSGSVDLDLFNGNMEALRALVVQPAPVVLIETAVARGLRMRTYAAGDPLAQLAQAYNVIGQSLREAADAPDRRALRAAHGHVGRALEAVLPRPAPRRKRVGVLAADDLTLGQMVPNRAERNVVGAATTVIRRGTPEFAALVRNTNPNVVFKDEEGTGADRMMTTKLSARVDALAARVAQEWSGTKLRITEAWDENMEHGTNSVHYEARAADMTTMPVDRSKLGRLGRLAVNAGFEWVFFENTLHIHASMSV